MIRLLFLALPIIYMPNALHLPLETGVPGINVSNIIFAIALIAALSGARHGSRPEERGVLTVPLLAYFGAVTVGFFIAQINSPGNTGDDIMWLKNFFFYPALYFVYRNCRLDRVQTRRLIILVMVVAAIAGLEAVREGLDYGFGRYVETRRASGPFGNDYHMANRAGVFYAMFLPMFLAMALFFREKRLWRIAALAGCAILVLAIMATYSRQAYAISLIGLSLLLLRKHVVLALLLACLALPIVSLLPESVTERVAETQQQDDSGVEQLDVSTASRFEIWSGAMRMWSAEPWGVGLRRFQQNIGRYSSWAGYDAHNFYVLTLAELGPLGIGSLLWLLWRLLRLSARIRQRLSNVDAESKALGLGFTISVIAMALGNMYGSPFAEGAVMANFWILCGLMEHYAAIATQTAPARALAASSMSMPPGMRAAPPTAAIPARYPLAAKMFPGKYRLPGGAVGSPPFRTRPEREIDAEPTPPG